MSYAGYGYGIGSSTGGIPAAYGLGINPLGPIIAAAISFNIELDEIENITVGRPVSVSFDIELYENLLKKLQANTEEIFSVNLSELTSTQIDFNPEVSFDINLLEEYITQLIVDEDITFDALLSMTSQEFIRAFSIVPVNITYVDEELRLLKIFREIRNHIIGKLEIRSYSIKFENRTFYVEDENE
jgi:hypothetical protein